jgi:TetR/AcrR family transcriptional regulator, cholesterol catabolism regulator
MSNVPTHILQRSEAMFMRYGIKSVTMDDLARELGMSKKTLYQYFETKEELIDQIIEQHIVKEQCMIEEVHAKSMNAIDEMIHVAQHVLNELRQVAPTATYDLQKYYRASFDKLQARFQVQIFNTIKENLERGIKEGLYRKTINTDIIARFYNMLSLTLIDEERFPSNKFPKEKMYLDFLDYHLHGIASPKGLVLFEEYRANIISKK